MNNLQCWAGDKSWVIQQSLEDLRFSRRRLWRIPSSKMWLQVAVVRTDVSEERIASIIRVERISELGTISHTDDGGDTFPRNVGSNKTRMASCPRRRHFSIHKPLLTVHRYGIPKDWRVAFVLVPLSVRIKISLQLFYKCWCRMLQSELMSPNHVVSTVKH
jgi:hypothetical protein